jgi:prepilin-type N-terminal cleavage/methylation domain-containing protein
MSRGEEGFTLVELLISTVILGILCGVITEAMIVGLRTSDNTDQRVRESVDAQLISVYFPRDAQAATQVTTGTVDACSNQISVAALSWPDPASAATTKRAAYVLGSTPSGERLLTRWYCDATGTSQRAVVQNLNSSLTPVSVTCSSACSGAPQTITMTLTDASGYSYSVSGTRRSS